MKTTVTERRNYLIIAVFFFVAGWLIHWAVTL